MLRTLSFFLATTLLPLAQAGEKLIGGRPATAEEFKSTVYIGGFCTASKIGAHTFLTAAHCMVNGATATVNGNFTKGALISVTTHYGPTAFLTVEEAFPHETYTTEMRRRAAAREATAGGAFKAYDIGLFTVVEETADIPVAEVDYLRVEADELVTIGGYGCEDDIFSRSGQRQYKVATAKVIATEFVTRDNYGRDIKDVDFFNFYSAGLKQDASAASICPGDSGGPAYRDSNGAVVGVNSQYVFSDASGVSFVNTHTRTSQVADWLLEHMK
jgi:secreted trypsin-like serine protease